MIPNSQFLHKILPMNMNYLIICLLRHSETSLCVTASELQTIFIMYVLLLLPQRSYDTGTARDTALHRAALKLGADKRHEPQ